MSTNKLLLELARRDEQLAKWDMLYSAIERELTAALAREAKLREALEHIAATSQLWHLLAPERCVYPIARAALFATSATCEKCRGSGVIFRLGDVGYDICDRCAALSTTSAEAKP
jgi:hypothetical protein